MSLNRDFSRKGYLAKWRSYATVMASPTTPPMSGVKVAALSQAYYFSTQLARVTTTPTINELHTCVPPHEIATNVAVPETAKRAPPIQSILVSFSCAVLFFGLSVSK